MVSFGFPEMPGFAFSPLWRLSCNAAPERTLRPRSYAITVFFLLKQKETSEAFCDLAALIAEAPTVLNAWAEYRFILLRKRDHCSSNFSSNFSCFLERESWTLIRQFWLPTGGYQRQCSKISIYPLPLQEGEAPGRLTGMGKVLMKERLLPGVGQALFPPTPNTLKSHRRITLSYRQQRRAGSTGQPFKTPWQHNHESILLLQIIMETIILAYFT